MIPYRNEITILTLNRLGADARGLIGLSQSLTGASDLTGCSLTILPIQYFSIQNAQKNSLSCPLSTRTGFVLVIDERANDKRAQDVRIKLAPRISPHNYARSKNGRNDEVQIHSSVDQLGI